MRLIPFIFLFLAIPTRGYQQRQKNTTTATTSSGTTTAARRPNLSVWEDDLVNEFLPSRQRRKGFLPKLLRKENRWDVIELVRGARGGSFNSNSLTGLDRTLRSLSLWLVGVVTCHSAVTVLHHDDNLFHEVGVCLGSTC
jgi:hypothetical protein